MDWGFDLWAHTGFIDKPHFQDDGKPIQVFVKTPVYGPYRKLFGPSIINEQAPFIEAIRNGSDDEATAALEILSRRTALNILEASGLDKMA